MKYLPALMINMKLVGYSLTFQKIAINCGTGESFINLNTTGSQQIY